MKKKIFTIIPLVLALAFFAACRNNDDNDDNGNGTGTDVVTTTPAAGGDDTSVAEANVLTRDQILARVADFPAPTGYIIARASVSPDANIWTASWTNNSANAMARFAMDGLQTMARDDQNNVFPNPMVLLGGELPDITDNADGSRTYTFHIYTDNRFSDGTLINAYHYAGGAAFFMHPNWGTVAPAISATPFITGRADFVAGDIDYITGIRIYSESSFSITAGAEFIPNVWEAFQHMMHSPVPLHALGVEAHDNGRGVYLTGLGGSPFTAEALNLVVNGGTPEYATDEDGAFIYNAQGQRQLLGGDGFRFTSPVVPGPWMFDSVDVGAGTLTLRANPYYPGTWDGYVPRFELFIQQYVPVDTTVDAMAAGTIHILHDVTVGDIIAESFSRLIDVQNPVHDFNAFPQLGQNIIQFHVDHGPTQFRAVRASIAFMLDRHAFAELFGRGFASVPHGQYAPAWWWFNEAAERGLHDQLIIYDLNMDEAIRLLVEDGWNYDANGNEFVGPGATGNYRHKWVDGELMELHINWVTAAAARPGRDAIELQLVDRALYAGMRLTQERTAQWASYLQGDHQIYHMFDVGIGFPILWMPWWLNDPANGPATNWANMDWPEVLAIGINIRDGEVLTETGRYNFVTNFIELVVALNYELDRIPMAMLTSHDFYPEWLGNWNGTGFWNIGFAITRTFDTRN